MRLFRSVAITAALISGAALAGVASAATTVSQCGSGVANSTTGCTIVFDGVSGTYGNANVKASPFTDVYNFDIASAGSLGLTLSSVGLSSNSDITFSLVRLNPPGAGGDVRLMNGSVGTVDFYSLSNQPAVAGTYRLRLDGSVAGATPNAAYSGTISFAPGAVPEPASWAMMILGMGAVGYTLRSAKRRSDAKLNARIKQITTGQVA